MPYVIPKGTRCKIDRAAMPIYYESRIAKLSLNEAELPKVDSEFEEVRYAGIGDIRRRITKKTPPIRLLEPGAFQTKVTTS